MQLVASQEDNDLTRGEGVFLCLTAEITDTLFVTI